MNLTRTILGKVEEKIQNLTIALNDQILNRNDTTFLVDLIGYENVLFNFTTTTIPVYSPVDGLFNFSIDGLFFDKLNQETHIHSDFQAIDMIA